MRRCSEALRCKASEYDIREIYEALYLDVLNERRALSAS